MSLDVAADRETLVARARDATAALAEHAAATERNRRPTPASLEAARSAGALALLTPVTAGGHGADTRTAVEVLAQLGRGCPSTAWIAGTCADSKILLNQVLTDQLRTEIYADPDVLICGAGMPIGHAEQVPGGLRVSGRWGYASGCEDSPWTVVFAMVAGDSDPRPALVAIPTADLVIEHTWNVAGLCGTGSHTITADEVFVPASRWAFLPTNAAGAPAFGSDPALAQRSALMLLAPLLGAAQGALDLVAAVLHERRPPLSAYASLAESPEARAVFSDADLLVRTARRRGLDAADAVDRTQPSVPLSDTITTTLRTEMVQAARECRTALEHLLDLHGSSGFATSNPLQRLWRDLAVGTRHAQFTPYLALEARGRALTTTPA